MRFLYDVAIFLYVCAIRIASAFGNAKARLWTEGRRDWKNKLVSTGIKNFKKRIWIHCASLGEFEQGRSLIDQFKIDFPETFIILTFFSPSGFEIRKNYKNADLVCYLPADTRRNAKDFIDLIAPTSIVFIKYEFWLNYFEAATKRNIPFFVVSAIFRPTQIFFKWYGNIFRNALKRVTHFFVQDKESKQLLNSIRINNVTVAGDTRFDRVRMVVSEKKSLSLIEEFRGNSKLLIAGSTWPEDEQLIFSISDEIKKSGYKIVIAPHEVSDKRTSEILDRAGKYFAKEKIVLYSTGNVSNDAEVLIIDSIGLLSSVYSYGSIAWIGGGFGKGIHNILEAAAYGIPVLFGPEFIKFREAVELKRLGGAYGVFDIKSAHRIFKMLANDKVKYDESSKISAEYVKLNTGATNIIMSELSKIISQ